MAFNHYDNTMDAMDEAPSTVVQQKNLHEMNTTDTNTINTNCQCGSDISGFTEDKTKIAALEQQLQYCMQCLDTERKSRLEAQARVKELEYDLKLTNRQLEQFQVQHLDTLHQRRLAALNRYKNEYYSDPKNQVNPSSGCSYEADGSEDEEDEIDGLMHRSNSYHVCISR